MAKCECLLYDRIKQGSFLSGSAFKVPIDRRFDTFVVANTSVAATFTSARTKWSEDASR
jgi:hypothetical protein